MKWCVQRYLFSFGTCNKVWFSVTSNSAIWCARSSSSSWISKSSSGIVSQLLWWAAKLCTNSYCPGRAKLIRVCLPCVKWIRRLLQCSSLLILVVGSSLLPKSMLSNWHLALQFWPKINKHGWQLTVSWRYSSSCRGKAIELSCPKKKAYKSY